MKADTIATAIAALEYRRMVLLTDLPNWRAGHTMRSNYLDEITAVDAALADLRGQMKQLTKKRKIEIANAIIENSDFADGLKQYRTIVRKMLLEVIDKALEEAQDGDE